MRTPFIKEDCLKTNGYRLVISTATGAFRVVTRIAALFHDIIILPVRCPIGCISRAYQGKYKKALKFLCIKVPKTTLIMTIGNIANIARGIIEMVPLIGNVLCYGFDELSKLSNWSIDDRTNFPLIKYDFLKTSSYFPGISTFTGTFRVITRATTLVCDTISIPIFGLFNSLENAIDGRPKEALKTLCIKIPLDILTATISNIANIARGIIEMVPFVGNGLCFALDKSSNDLESSLYDRMELPLIKDDTLKIMGYRPLFSTGSGAFRVVTRTAILVHDIFAVVFFDTRDSIEAVIKKNPKEALKTLCIKLPRDILTATISNTANIARGIIEMVPFAGNGLCYGFDTMSDKLSALYRARQNRGSRNFSSPVGESNK
jgi:hypothetical protein